ncbi:MAG: outer membrane protein OmpA-like peptidoglycan-associated protein [Polaribacter sp.]|jgi:outer membrane protein OmpA-like peptidoglycan-associated protein
MKRNLKIMFVLLSFSFVIQSQTKLEVRAVKAYNQKDYTKAIEKYNAISKQKQLTSKQRLNLANSYYKIKDYQNAAKKYMSCISEGDTLSLPAYNNYLQSLKLFNYSEDFITAVINTILDSLPKEIIKRYDMSLTEEPFSKTSTSYEVKNLDVNSKKSDFGVSIFPDSTVMFSSSRENKSYNYIYKKIKQPFINIYKSKLKKDNSIDTLTTEKYIKSSMMHSSSPFYDSMYKRLFYTQSYTEKNKLKFKNSTSNFRIAFGVLNAKKQLKKITYYPKEANGYSYGHPFFDKKTKRLYFISDMPGGSGGTDIYYILMNEKGYSSEPVNLGKKVNSFANEMFPSIFDNQLYFSTDLFIGKGGLDVYSSEIKNNEIEYPLLLNDTINSSADDFDYKIVKQDKQSKRGYISSNKKGGKGSDDIYSFTEYKTLKEILVTGVIFEKIKDATKTPKIPKTIPSATIKISKKKGKVLHTISSNKDGKYSIRLPIGSDYFFKIDKEKYFGTSGNVLLADKKNLLPVTKDFHLKKELIVDKYGNLKINLNPISFKYDSADITTTGEEQLMVVIDYLNKYPTDNIKLEAHTDSRGKGAYNLALSVKRAKSVNDYLLNKGITPDRMVSVKGFGETKLINKCKNCVKCSKLEHKQNRRTDFVIIRNYLK